MKTKIWTISRHKIVQNLIIVCVLIALSTVAVFGVNYITSSKMYNGVYYSGNEQSNKVSLMINVYWGTEFLDEMLKTLQQYNVKTTFFVGGTWAVQESDMLQKIFDAGHEIGNHGYYHKDQGKLSADKNHEEIYNTHKIVKELLGIDMNLFAPPSGSYNKKTVEIASELGYKTIMWTDGRDTIDWRDKDSNLIYNRAVKNCKGGDFVLMHPTEATKNALPNIIKTLQEQGFELCTVSENLK
ncbi:MAG: polysaccharide deacetylase family protein [Candidatus Caccovivens sp.]